MAGPWGGSVGDGIVDVEEEWIGTQGVEIAEAGKTQAGAGSGEEEGSGDGDGDSYGRGTEVKRIFHGQSILLSAVRLFFGVVGPAVPDTSGEAGPTRQRMSNREECHCELIS